MKPFSDCFAFGYVVLFAIFNQLFVCFCIQPKAYANIDRVYFLWPSCSWTHYITPLLSLLK